MRARGVVFRTTTNSSSSVFWFGRLYEYRLQYEYSYLVPYVQYPVLSTSTVISSVIHVPAEGQTFGSGRLSRPKCHVARGE